MSIYLVIFYLLYLSYEISVLTDIANQPQTDQESVKQQYLAQVMKMEKLISDGQTNIAPKVSKRISVKFRLIFKRICEQKNIALT